MSDPTSEPAEHVKQQILSAFGFDSEAELNAAIEEELPGYLAAHAEWEAEKAAFTTELQDRLEEAQQAVAAFLRDQGALPDGTELGVTPMDLEADPLWVAPAPWAQATSAAEPSDVLARIDAAIDDWEDGPDAARWFPDMPEGDDSVRPPFAGLLATLDGAYAGPYAVPARHPRMWIGDHEVLITSVEIEFDTVPMPQQEARKRIRQLVHRLLGIHSPSGEAVGTCWCQRGRRTKHRNRRRKS